MHFETYSHEKLALRYPEKPHKKRFSFWWIFEKLFFLACAVIALVSFWHAITDFHHSEGFFPGIVLIAVLLVFQWYRHRHHMITMDQSNGTLSFENKIGRWTTSQTNIPISEIQSVRVEEVKDSDGSTTATLYCARDVTYAGKDMKLLTSAQLDHVHYTAGKLTAWLDSHRPPA